MKNKTQKIKMLAPVTGIDWSAETGEIVEVREQLAKNLVRSSLAEFVHESKIEKATLPPQVETPEQPKAEAEEKPKPKRKKAPAKKVEKPESAGE